MYKYHTRLNLVEGGNRFKQGDRITLAFAALNSKGEVIDLTGKTIHGEIYSTHKGVVYEKSATFDAVKKQILFAIDKTIDNGTFQVEFTVTSSSDANYRLKIPSDPTDGRISIMGSSDNMDFVGAKMTTVSQLRLEQTNLQAEYENKINPKITAVEQKAADLAKRVEDGIGAFTSSTEIVDARGGEANLRSRLDKTAAQLADKVTYLDFYRKSKVGKKIVMVGDSTTGSAPAIYTRLGLYTQAGGILDGAVVSNRGLSGNTINNFVNNISGNPLSSVISDQADLYVFSYGINDIRAGLDSPGRSVAQITADLKTAIDALLTQTKGYILLRIPNPFLSSDPTNKGWVTPLANAQLYSDQLYQIYESFRGYSNRVDIIDIPSLVFGKKCLPSHPYMLDQLHPNDIGYTAMADEIARHISNTKKDVTDNVLLKGAITGIDTTAGTISFTTPSDSIPKLNDIVYVGHNASFPILSAPVSLGANKWRISYDPKIKVSHGVLSITTKSELALKTNNSEALETDWIKAKLAPVAADTGTQIELVIDLQSYGLTGTQPVFGSYKYYLEDTRIASLTQGFWFNNNADPAVIVGGTNNNGLTSRITPEFGKVSSFSSTVNLDVTGQRYLHYLVSMPTIPAGQTDLTIEVGNLNLEIGGKKLNLAGLSWFHYRGLPQTVITKVAERNVLATYDYVYGIEKRVLDTTVNKSRNWLKALITKTGAVPTYIKVAIPISSFGWTSSKSFKLAYKYHTKSSIATKAGGTLYFSNDPVTITGGINVSFPDLGVRYGETAAFEGTLSANPTGYTHLHLLTKVTISGAGDLKFEMGEVSLSVDNVQLDLTNLSWSIHTPEAGAKLLTNLYAGDYSLTYREFIDELLLRSLI